MNKLVENIIDDLMQWEQQDCKERISGYLSDLKNNTLILSIRDKVDLISQLIQQNHKPIFEKFIYTLLIHTKGKRLTELKELINCSNSRYDLEYLIFEFTTDLEYQQLLLYHFAKEAEQNNIKKIHILSDIDDTIISSLNDKRLPRGLIYPGLLQLHKEIEGLTIITGRPSLKGVFKNHTHRMLNKFGIRDRAILTGDLKNSFIAPLSLEPMILKKNEKFRQYKKLFPEYEFIWFGDSGQGDIKTGINILGQTPELKLALIQNIGNLSNEEIAKYQDENSNLRFFNTYAGAAGILYKRNIIDHTALDRILKETELDIHKIDYQKNDKKDYFMKLFRWELDWIEKLLAGRRSA